MGKRKAKSKSVEKCDPMNISEEGESEEMSEGEKSELSEVIVIIFLLFLVKKFFSYILYQQILSLIYYRKN